MIGNLYRKFIEYRARNAARKIERKFFKLGEEIAEDYITANYAAIGNANAQTIVSNINNRIFLA